MLPPFVANSIRDQLTPRDVLLCFASADLLYMLSFPNIFDENSEDGYQYPFNESHSLDFRCYIKITYSSTIPFKLNLCQISNGIRWLIALVEGKVRLELNACLEKYIAQVDNQHQVGCLDDFQAVLPFMCFTGYTVNDEMEVFSIIFGDANGRSYNLLDYLTSQLTESLLQERLGLFTALNFKSNDGLPKLRWLSLSGKTTLSFNGNIVLSMIQRVINNFLKATAILSTNFLKDTAGIVFDCWAAVLSVLPKILKGPRQHMLKRAIGLNTLMSFVADIFLECRDVGQHCDQKAISSSLVDITCAVNLHMLVLLKGFCRHVGVRDDVVHLCYMRNLV